MTGAWLRRGRLAAFSAIAAFILLSPAYQSVLGGASPFVRTWKMFSRAGLGVVDARFAEREPDGRERPVDRFALLGYAERKDAPPGLRRIVGAEELDAVVARLCEALGPDRDLRVRARLATESGWQTLDMGRHGRCAAP